MNTVLRHLFAARRFTNGAHPLLSVEPHEVRRPSASAESSWMNVCTRGCRNGIETPVKCCFRR
eukprot:2078781-Prymnesium_polylepis.1